MPMRGIDDHDVDSRLHQRSDPLLSVDARTDRCADAQRPEPVLAGVGIVSRLLEVLGRNQAT